MKRLIDFSWTEPGLLMDKTARDATQRVAAGSTVGVLFTVGFT